MKRGEGLGTIIGIKHQKFAGKEFPYFTVIKAVGKRKTGNFLWLCQCICGNEFVTSSYYIKDRKKILSCGCQNKISPAKNLRFSTGRRRCTNCKYRIKYQDIKVCRRFMCNKMKFPVDLNQENLNFTCDGWGPTNLKVGKILATSEAIQCEIIDMTSFSVTLKITTPGNFPYTKVVDIDNKWQGEVNLENVR